MSGSQTMPGTAAVPSIQMRAGRTTWSIGAVRSQAVLIWRPSWICEAERTCPRCGEYHATIAATETPRADHRRAPHSRVARNDCSGHDEGDAELRQRPGSDHARSAHGYDRRCPSVSHGLQRGDHDDAHREESEPVTARLARDVEQEWGDRCEEEKQDAGQSVDA